MKVADKIIKQTYEKGYETTVEELDIKNLAMVKFKRLLFKRQYRVVFIYDDNVGCRVVMDEAHIKIKDHDLLISNILDVINSIRDTKCKVIKSFMNTVLINIPIYERMVSNINHQSQK